MSPLPPQVGSRRLWPSSEQPATPGPPSPSRPLRDKPADEASRSQRPVISMVKLRCAPGAVGKGCCPRCTPRARPVQPGRAGAARKREPRKSAVVGDTERDDGRAPNIDGGAAHARELPHDFATVVGSPQRCRSRGYCRLRRSTPPAPPHAPQPVQRCAFARGIALRCRLRLSLAAASRASPRSLAALPAGAATPTGGAVSSLLRLQALGGLLPGLQAARPALRATGSGRAAAAARGSPEGADAGARDCHGRRPRRRLCAFLRLPGCNPLRSQSGRSAMSARRPARHRRSSC